MRFWLMNVISLFLVQLNLASLSWASTATTAAVSRKCSACEAVAFELGERLKNERKRNALDTRHRLDKDGKRYGKVIDYSVSELRAIELLDDLCSEMEAYRLSKDEKTFVRAKERILNKNQQVEAQRKQIKNLCSDIIGEWEDELAIRIRKGVATANSSLQQMLCVEMTGLCNPGKPHEAEL